MSSNAQILRTLDEASSAEALLSIGDESELESLLCDFTDEEAAQLIYDWELWARPKQRWSPDWKRGKLLLGGRGFGKTRTAMELSRMAVEEYEYRNLMLAGPTSRDTRRIMLTGKSGMLSICPPWNRPIWHKADMWLEWPNGARAELFTAEKPDMFRGPEADFGAFEELAAWPRLDNMDVDPFGTAQRAIRLPHKMGARWIGATTPRPRRTLRDLVKDPNVVVIQGSSMENLANLDTDFYSSVLEPLIGTTLGRQEIMGELLMSFPEQVYDMFVESQDVISRDQLPDKFEAVIGGLDWGGSNPTAFYLIGIHKGKFYVFHEYYVANERSQPKYDNIKRLCDLFNVSVVYIDPAASQQYKDLAAMDVPVRRAKNAVEDGIVCVQTHMEKGRFYVVDSCHNLIDEIAMYSYRVDANGNVLERVPIKANDHGVDAVRYAIFTYGDPSRSHSVNVPDMSSGGHIATSEY